MTATSGGPRRPRPNVGTVTTASSADTESHDDPAATAPKIATATISDESPDTDVTVARAGPLMLSCNLASLATTALSIRP